MKNKECKVCKEKFKPLRPLQVVCFKHECVIEYIRIQKEKKAAKEALKHRQELRKSKEKLKTRSDWMKEAQAVFNAYIRLRDKDLPCISSGVMNATWDAGHYRSVGSAPALRFCELNVHKQRVHDNQHLHGNLIEYRKRLIDRIGLDKVEWLEGPHEPKKYSIDDLKEIKSKYSRLIKEMKNGVES